MSGQIWYYKVHGIVFQWDSEKERVNILKHGVPFQSACYVFEDENNYEFYDSKHSLEEDRYVVIGLAGAYLLTVVYTMRGDMFRIISARMANSRERRLYLGWQL